MMPATTATAAETAACARCAAPVIIPNYSPAWIYDGVCADCAATRYIAGAADADGPVAVAGNPHTTVGAAVTAGIDALIANANARA